MRNQPNRFVFKQDHRLLLSNAVVRWEDWEYGAPAIDCKRPYGNTNVRGDIEEILGRPISEEEARELHEGTLIALSILLQMGRYPDHYEVEFEHNGKFWVEIEDELDS